MLCVSVLVWQLQVRVELGWKSMLLCENRRVDRKVEVRAQVLCGECPEANYAVLMKLLKHSKSLMGTDVSLWGKIDIRTLACLC